MTETCSAPVWPLKTSGHHTCVLRRQWCDAKAAATIIIEQDATGMDTIVVDLATLRLESAAAALAHSLCRGLAASHAGVQLLPPGARACDDVPFQTMPSAVVAAAEAQGSAQTVPSAAAAAEAWPAAEAQDSASSSDCSSGSGDAGPVVLPVQALQAAAAVQPGGQEAASCISASLVEAAQAKVTPWVGWLGWAGVSGQALAGACCSSAA
jgi:hypothetical protein